MSLQHLDNLIARLHGGKKSKNKPSKRRKHNKKQQRTISGSGTGASAQKTQRTGLPPIPEHFWNKGEAVFCGVCRKWLSGDSQMQAHTRGKAHKACELRLQTVPGADAEVLFDDMTRLQQSKALFELVTRYWPIAYHTPATDDRVTCAHVPAPTKLRLEISTWLEGGRNEGRDITVNSTHSGTSLEHADNGRGDDDGVLLFYQYARVTDVGALRQWQLDLCNALGMKGRVRVAPEGINGTLGGCSQATRLYRFALLGHSEFHFVPDDFKTGLGLGDARSFPTLSIVSCAEIVVLGLPPEVRPNNLSSHLSPTQFHDVLQAVERGDTAAQDVCLLDCRNYYESDVGRFQGPAGMETLNPLTRQFSEFPAKAQAMVDTQNLKNKTVLMYCTGGIRCERASTFLVNQGCERVFQLHGGIHKYMQTFPEGGYWKGKLFVFDRRSTVALPKNNKQEQDIVGQCVLCSRPHDEYNTRLRCGPCRVLLLVCDECAAPHLNSRTSLALCCKQCQSSKLQRDDCAAER